MFLSTCLKNKLWTKEVMIMLDSSGEKKIEKTWETQVSRYNSVFWDHGESKAPRGNYKFSYAIWTHWIVLLNEKKVIIWMEIYHKCRGSY